MPALDAVQEWGGLSQICALSWAGLSLLSRRNASRQVTSWIASSREHSLVA